MLRLWHHVGEGPARAVLFEDFVIGGRSLGLIEAIVCTARDGRWHGRLPRGLHHMPADGGAEIDRLGRVLAHSLAEVMGRAATPMVQRAWRETAMLLLARPAIG